MPGLTFTYNGISSSTMGISVVGPSGLKRELKPNTDLTIQQVGGKAGGYFMNKKVGTRKISIDVFFTETNEELATQKLKDIAYWLDADEPKALTFSDEPGITYYAMFNGDSVVDQLYAVRKTTLEFICPDPFAYGDEITEILTLSDNHFKVPGTTKAFPLYTFELTGDVSMLRMDKERGTFLKLGEAPEEAAAPYEKYTNIFADAMGSLTGWSTGTFSDSGTVTGTMATNGYQFEPSTYSTGSTWHGPNMHKATSATANDFRAEFTLHLDCNENKRRRGRIVFHLLSSSNARIGYIVIADPYKDQKQTKVSCYVKQLNGSSTYKKIIETTGPKSTSYNDFKGKVILTREGAVWSFECFKLDSKNKPYHKKSAKWKDTTTGSVVALGAMEVEISTYGVTTLAISHVARTAADSATITTSTAHGLHTGDVVTIDCNDNEYDGTKKVIGITSSTKFKVHDGGSTDTEKSATGTVYIRNTPESAYVTHCKIDKINAAQTGPHNIARTGDTIKVDSYNASVLKNDVHFMKDLDFGSQFFGLEPSFNIVRKGRNASIATITTDRLHNLAIGDKVYVDSLKPDLADGYGNFATDSNSDGVADGGFYITSAAWLTREIVLNDGLYWQKWSGTNNSGSAAWPALTFGYFGSSDFTAGTQSIRAEFDITASASDGATIHYQNAMWTDVGHTTLLGWNSFQITSTSVTNQHCVYETIIPTTCAEIRPELFASVPNGGTFSMEVTNYKVNIVDLPYNGHVKVTAVPTSTSFSYSNPGSYTAAADAEGTVDDVFTLSLNNEDNIDTSLSTITYRPRYL